jgi:hypothetical protein
MWFSKLAVYIIRRFCAPSIAISSGVNRLFSSAWFHILRRLTVGASARFAYMRAYGWASVGWVVPCVPDAAVADAESDVGRDEDLVSFRLVATLGRPRPFEGVARGTSTPWTAR